MSNVTLYASKQYFRGYSDAIIKSGVIILTMMIGVGISLWALFSYGLNIAAESQCEEIAKNSSYTTKYTHDTCWIRINDGADGTSEAWVPSEWMTMG